LVVGADRGAAHPIAEVAQSGTAGRNLGGTEIIPLDGAIRKCYGRAGGDSKAS
jgi:hypothetical protein